MARDLISTWIGYPCANFINDPLFLQMTIASLFLLSQLSLSSDTIPFMGVRPDRPCLAIVALPELRRSRRRCKNKASGISIVACFDLPF